MAVCKKTSKKNRHCDKIYYAILKYIVCNHVLLSFIASVKFAFCALMLSCYRATADILDSGGILAVKYRYDMK